MVLNRTSGTRRTRRNGPARRSKNSSANRLGPRKRAHSIHTTAAMEITRMVADTPMAEATLVEGAVVLPVAWEEVDLWELVVEAVIPAAWAAAGAAGAGDSLWNRSREPFAGRAPSP